MLYVCVYVQHVCYVQLCMCVFGMRWRRTHTGIGHGTVGWEEMVVVG